MSNVASPSGARVGEKTFKDREKRNKGQIWWSNGIFFISLHLFAIIGMAYLSPASSLDWRTTVLCIISWQLASFGVTIGYHRLWSHRAFTATLPLRIVLAWMGSMGFQGSIKWWVLRHRLHHRFTDSEQHDPYAATKGLWYSHCGWIFRKPIYPRMKLIERADLEADPVVRFQHKFYVPIALFSGLILPALLGAMWDDALGGLVWGGAVARLLIWHTTFCINSLAHWTGLQPYTEEVTARGNYFLALLTSGEGNHNFHHAFPKDYRNGPHPADWDPTKWIIYAFHTYTPFVPTVAITPKSAIYSARARVHHHHAERLLSSVPPEEKVRRKEDLPVWSKAEVLRRNGSPVLLEDGGRRRMILLLLEGCIVDAGSYIEDHPGGRELLLAHSVSPIKASMPSISLSLPSSASSTRMRRAPSPRPPFTSFNLPYRGPNSPDSDSPDSIADDEGSWSPRSGMSSATSLSEGDDYITFKPKSAEGKEKEEVEDEHGMEREVLMRQEEVLELQDATRAFFGGMNNHSGAAKERMRCLRVARLAEVE